LVFVFYINKIEILLNLYDTDIFNYNKSSSNKMNNKDIVNAYKKPKARTPFKRSNHNDYRGYLFMACIPLLFCAPTLAIGIIKGKCISKIVTSSLLAIAGSLGLSIVSVLPSMGSDNPHFIRPGTNLVMGAMLLCSYGLQIAVNMM
jgi:hypothetical protein